MFLSKIIQDQITDIFFNPKKLSQARDYFSEIIAAAKQSAQEKTKRIDSDLLRFQTAIAYPYDFQKIDEKLFKVPERFHNQLPIRYLYALSKRESNHMLDIMTEYGRLKNFTTLDPFYIQLYCFSYLNYCDYLKIDPEIELNKPRPAFYQSQKKLINFFLKTDPKTLDRNIGLRLQQTVIVLIQKNSIELQLKTSNKAQINFLNFLLKNKQALSQKLSAEPDSASVEAFHYLFSVLENKLNRI